MKTRIVNVVSAAALLSVLAGSACAAADAGPRASERRMSDLRISATVPIARKVDWVAVVADGVWVGNSGPDGVTRIDPVTRQATTVVLPGKPCSGLAADADDLWVPLCGPKPGLAKIDLRKHTLSAVFDVGPAGPEGGVAAGAGGVWMVTDRQGTLARIDPSNGAVVGTVHLPPGSYNPLFVDGRVWVTRAEGAEVTIVDAAAAKVVGEVPVGSKPRFLTAEAGAVWTLDQAEGALSRIDLAGNHAVTTLPLQTPGPGGDITHAEGEVWTTMLGTPLTVVDAARSVVLCQWKGAGGDAIGIGHGAIWLTNLKDGTVSRIALADIPQDCRAKRRAR